MENTGVVTGNLQHATGRVVYDALVLDARLRQSLATVRSLGSRGLRVAVLETVNGLPAPALSSRWCQKYAICQENEGTKEYLTCLEQVLDTTGARVLITSSDGTIALIRQHREQLEKRVRIALAKESALSIAVNKEQTLEVARQLGMGVPHALTLGSVSEVGEALYEIGLPAVVKPVESWLWGGQQGARVISQLVTTPDEARCAVEQLTYSGGTVLFQQFLSGRRESLSFFYANGEIYARYAFWGKRTNPPLGGVYTLRQSIPFPEDTGIQAERLIREIDLEGYSQVEFRRDSAGKPYLMEINPRLNLGIGGAVRDGVDFPHLLYSWANGDRLEKVNGYRTNTYMRYLGGDIMTTLASIRQRGRPGVTPPARAILDFLGTFFLPGGYDYVDWRDPLPIWTATRGFARWALQQIKYELSQRKPSRASSVGTERVRKV